MSTATITPLRHGAVLEVDGRTERFDSFSDAQDDAHARGLTVVVQRFPTLPLVLAVSPALHVVP